MKNFFIFIGKIILVMLLISFHAWIYMMAYELAFTPFVNYFTIAPQMPYSIFVLLTIGMALCRAFKKPENDVGSKEFWSVLVSSIATKLGILLILWCVNSIIM